MTFSFDVTWLDGPKAMPLQFCPGKGGERITETGAAAVEQKDQTASYLTQLPARLAQRAASSLSVPTGEIELALAVSAKGVEVSFWILEFAGEQQIAKTSWPVLRDKVVVWKPHRDCETIRLAWRLKGSGTLDTARLVSQERGSDAKLTARHLKTWRALNALKGSIGEIETARDCPSQLGPAPDVIAPVDVATHPVLSALGIDPAKLEVDGDPILAEDQLRVWPFLKRVITDRRYAWKCPFTGETLHSSDAVIVSEPAGRPYVFVRFESAGHVMFLILSAFRSSRVGVYFPIEELVVSRLKLGSLVCALRSLAVRHAGELERYLGTTERRTLIPLNTMSHWGHVLLNELDALQWLFDSGNDANVDLWLQGEVGFFKLDELFDEIPPTKLRAAMSTDERFAICLRENAMVVRPQIASYFLGDKAGDRLVDYWRREGERDGSTAAIAARLDGRSPVIWVEVRANDRLWTNQREGLVAVIEKLRAGYPKLTVIFAGWSRMLGVSADDEKMIATETQFVTSLSDALPGIHCIPLLGVMTGEKMRWALACDFHLSIVGSGILFPMLAGLPGVIVSSVYYQENDLFIGDTQKQVRWVTGVDKAVVLPKQFVTDDVSIQNAEVRNFAVDPDALANLVESELAKVRLG